MHASLPSMVRANHQLDYQNGWQQQQHIIETSTAVPTSKTSENNSMRKIKVRQSPLVGLNVKQRCNEVINLCLFICQ